MSLARRSPCGARRRRLASSSSTLAETFSSSSSTAHVAETRSFSRAAERLEMTRSAVSKHVQQLERQLEVQLLVRTTHKLALTDAGERVFASSRAVEPVTRVPARREHQTSSRDFRRAR